LIDDSRSVQAFLSQCLETVALSIETAPDGRAGLIKYQNNPIGLDVIFLDWEMPIMDGPTTFKNLSDLGIKIPVIMLTSKNEPSDIVHMLEAGVADYILKPFTQDLILEKLAYVMGSQYDQ